MAVAPNFYYSGDSQLGPTIGAMIGQALFGNPELRAKQQLQEAQMGAYDAQAQEARAHAGLYGSQQTGQDTQNSASSSLPKLIAGLFNVAPAASPDAATPPAVHPEGFSQSDPLAPLPDASPAPGSVSFDPQTFRNGLPALIAAMGQMQGDKIDPNKIVGLAAAMMGNDEFARRGMVGEGVTPGANFAITPERADQIAANKAADDYRQATSVATINHASDVPVANIHAQAEERGQDVTAATQRRGQDLEHQDRVYGINTKAGANIQDGAGANVLARALGPNAVITSNARTPEEQRQVYATQHPGVAPIMDSAHLDAADGYPAFDVRPIPGETFEQAKAKVAAQAAAQGGYLRFAQDEGTHWHFDIRGVKASTKSVASTVAGTMKPVNKSAADMINNEITTQLASRGIAGQPDPGTMDRIRQAAYSVYQRTGNAPSAVSSTLDVLQQKWAAKQAAAKGSSPASSTPVKVSSPQEAARLPAGTLFQTPDGRVIRKS